MAELPHDVAMATAGAAAAASTPASARERGFGGKPWFWFTWPPLVALDLWSKAVVFAHLERTKPAGVPLDHHQPTVFDTAVLKFQIVGWGNPGTIWGLLQNGTIPLMVVRCFAVVGLFWFLRNTWRAAKLQQFVLGLILAGAIGNLYDNFTRADRTVRDFLRFSGTWPFDWGFPAFNVADSCITVGAIGLFLLLWRDDRAAANKKVS